MMFGVRFKQIILVFIAVILLSGCSQLPFGSKDQGALQVESNSQFLVYIDGEQVGETPYFSEELAVGNYQLKLEPVSSDLKEWQVPIQISKRRLTFVRYDANQELHKASSVMLFLEPAPDQSKTMASVTTIPASASVRLDGQVLGFAPIETDQISSGDHELLIEAAGYESKALNVKAVSGHILRVRVELARNAEELLGQTTKPSEPTNQLTDPDPSPEPSATPKTKTTTATPKPSPTPKPTPGLYQETNGIVSGAVKASQLDKPYVQILEASPGITWLRVRSEPTGLADNELTKVKVGTYFPFISISDNQEWYEIEYQPGKTGYMAAQFGKLVE